MYTAWDDFEKKLFSTIAVLPARVTRFLRGRVLSGPNEFEHPTHDF